MKLYLKKCRFELRTCKYYVFLSQIVRPKYGTWIPTKKSPPLLNTNVMSVSSNSFPTVDLRWQSTSLPLRYVLLYTVMIFITYVMLLFFILLLASVQLWKYSRSAVVLWYSGAITVFYRYRYGTWDNKLSLKPSVAVSYRRSVTHQ